MPFKQLICAQVQLSMKKLSLICATFFCVFCHTNVFSQESKPTDIDSTAVIDSLLAEMALYGDLMDSVNNKSYVDLNIGIGNGFFVSKDPTVTNTANSAIYLLGGGYYHKTGFSLTGILQAVNENGRLNLYQANLTAAYDYSKGQQFAYGGSFTKYFNSGSTGYTASIINNEVYTYIQYKKSWFNPSLAFDYGWGQSSETVVRTIRRPNGQIVTVPVTTNTKGSDFSMIASVGHEWEKTGLLTSNDVLNFSPLLFLSAGTSTYGLNNTIGSGGGLQNSRLRNSGGSETTKFQPQSISLLLNTNYYFGLFYIAPQILVDYSLQYPEDPLSSIFSVNLGLNF
jgi:hypothetical protein